MSQLTGVMKTTFLWAGLCYASIVVEHLSHNIMIEGLNPATGTGRTKIVVFIIINLVTTKAAAKHEL